MTRERHTDGNRTYSAGPSSIRRCTHPRSRRPSFLCHAARWHGRSLCRSFPCTRILPRRPSIIARKHIIFALGEKDKAASWPLKPRQTPQKINVQFSLNPATRERAEFHEWPEVVESGYLAALPPAAIRSASRECICAESLRVLQAHLCLLLLDQRWILPLLQSLKVLGEG